MPGMARLLLLPWVGLQAKYPYLNCIYVSSLFELKKAYPLYHIVQGWGHPGVLADLRFPSVNSYLDFSKAKLEIKIYWVKAEKKSSLNMEFIPKDRYSVLLSEYKLVR